MSTCSLPTPLSSTRRNLSGRRPMGRSPMEHLKTWPPSIEISDERSGESGSLRSFSGVASMLLT